MSAERMPINDDLIAMVTGGSICISKDGTTCGYNCDNQYRIIDMEGLSTYYVAHMKEDERDILKACVGKYIEAL